MHQNILAPVARQLDVLWLEDRASFIDVTVAAARIEDILRTIAPAPSGVVRATKQAIFASVPGEDHTLGVRMAADLQRAKGWEIHLTVDESQNDLLEIVAASSSQILGLSIGSSQSMHKLYALVRALKTTKPDLKILVSGSLIATDMRPFQLLGVDAVADTFEQAEAMLDDFAAQTAMDAVQAVP